MRNITKIFLLIVAAFVVYLIWPRTPNLKGFDPAELAKLQVEAWHAEKDGKGMASLIALYKIYTAQFHFSPLAAFRMAQSQKAALAEMKRLQSAGENADESKALEAFTEKYSLMKRQASEQTDPDALAREEYAVYSLALGGAPTNEVAEPVSRIMAARYGGAAQDFMDAAMNIAQAQVMVWAAQSQGDEGQGALDYAREGYKLLKEVANTPVTAPAAQP